jgi:hypothetical protein
MYICTRETLAGWPPADALDVETAADRDPRAPSPDSAVVWTSVFGRPKGAIRWSLRVNHLVEVQHWMDADDAVGTPGEPRTSERERPSGVVDNVAEILMNTGDAAPGALASVTTAQCAPGHSAEAMAWGSDLTRLLLHLTDRPVTYFRNLFGPVTELGWILELTGFDDVERIDRMVTTDPGWIDSTGDGLAFFLPGSFSQMLWRLVT